MKIGSAIQPGTGSRKKDTTGSMKRLKKSHNGYVSSVWGDSPTVPIETKICVTGNLPDRIRC